MIKFPESSFMKKKPFYISGLTVVAVVLFNLFTTVVDQGWTTILMSFGKPVRVLSDPGLHFKLPYPFHQAEKIDARLLMLQPRPSEYLTADKKNLILESAICYKIADPILFKKTVRDKKGVEMRLTDLLSSHTGLLLGVKELSELVNVNKENIKFRELNEELTSTMQQNGKDLGVDVKQVFMKRIMLPRENRVAVYSRMRAERSRIAKKYLAEGEEEALKIRATADKESRTILAEAKRKAAVIKGKADAEAMKIAGNTYRKNPFFYNYLRSLEVYEKIFNEKTVIILDEKSPVVKSLFSGDK